MLKGVLLLTWQIREWDKHHAALSSLGKRGPVIRPLHDVQDLLAVLGANWDHKTPTWSELIEERLRDGRRCSAYMNGVVRRRARPAHSTIPFHNANAAALFPIRLARTEDRAGACHKLRDMLDSDDLTGRADHVSKNHRQIAAPAANVEHRAPLQPRRGLPSARPSSHACAER